MKKVIGVVFITLALVAGSFSAAIAKFPEKPIKLIVYTKPGGAIDVFARKFTTIAAKYTDATFVVVNKSGAGGIVAIKHILSSKPDGYQFAAVTKSNIGKIVSGGLELGSDRLDESHHTRRRSDLREQNRIRTQIPSYHAQACKMVGP